MSLGMITSLSLGGHTKKLLEVNLGNQYWPISARSQGLQNPLLNVSLVKRLPSALTATGTKPYKAFVV